MHKYWVRQLANATYALLRRNHLGADVFVMAKDGVNVLKFSSHAEAQGTADRLNQALAGRKCKHCGAAIERSGDGWKHVNGLVSCRPQATRAEPEDEPTATEWDRFLTGFNNEYDHDQEVADKSDEPEDI